MNAHDTLRVARAQAFRQAKTESIAFKELTHEIKARLDAIWIEFVHLPPEEKTAAKGMQNQGKWLALTDILEWIEDEIRAGEAIVDQQIRFGSQPAKAGP